MWVLKQALHLLHPIMPFLTEELWGQLFDDKTLLQAQGWPALPQSLKNPAAREKIEMIIAAISGIRAARQALNVPASVQIPLRITGASPALQSELQSATPMIQRLARLAEITFDTATPRHGEAQIALNDALLLLPLEGVIDFAAESARLSKQAEKLSKEIAGLESRLGNSDFVAGAPEEIIEEQREKLAAAQDNYTKVRAAIAQITGN
jgi:valyl-tRNA synthetase